MGTRTTKTTEQTFTRKDVMRHFGWGSYRTLRQMVKDRILPPAARGTKHRSLWTERQIGEAENNLTRMHRDPPRRKAALPGYDVIIEYQPPFKRDIIEEFIRLHTAITDKLPLHAKKFVQ